jgi:aspartyl-tRNA(Asn)/glutamyl-tRNA(Gln) amidotransferase subunit B
MRSPDEAYLYLTALKQVMQYADISDCDMEKGQMRCDVNISVKPLDQKHFNKKTELKNLNSFKAVHRCIEFEIERQIDLLDEGRELLQTTRGWNDDRGESYHMRSKEGDADYRYFPEPDMMPIELSDERLAEIRTSVPRTPAARRAAYVADHGLSDYDAHVLTLDKPTADYFDAVIATGADAKKAANWITNDLNRELAAANQNIADCRVTPAALAELIGLIDAGDINSKIARDVFAILVAEGGSPADIVEAKGWKQESDSGAIEALVVQVIAANPGPAQEYRDGQAKALNFLVGQVMKLSKGKANPAQTREMLEAKLNG